MSPKPIVSHKTTVMPTTDGCGHLICPRCDGTEFQRGPKAGLSINLRCRCGAVWNDTPFGLDALNDLARGAIAHL